MNTNIQRYAIVVDQGIMKALSIDEVPRDLNEAHKLWVLKAASPEDAEDRYMKIFCPVNRVLIQR